MSSYVEGPPYVEASANLTLSYLKVTPSSSRPVCEDPLIVHMYFPQAHILQALIDSRSPALPAQKHFLQHHPKHNHLI